MASKYVNKMKFDEIKDYISNSTPQTKIYIGCDSVRRRKKINGKESWFATYGRVVVIHRHSFSGMGEGCKVFADKITIPDYGVVESSGKIKNLRQRMIQEVTYALEVFEEIWESFDDREFQIHLDINSDEKAPSHVALKEARGYVRAVTGQDPEFKPIAPAASFAADLHVHGGLNTR